MKPVQETNKIIAKYTDAIGKDQGSLILLCRNVPVVGWYNINELKYHSSMDWLYPVARKLKIDLEIFLKKQLEAGDYLSHYEGTKPYDELIRAGSEFNIEFLYPAVVEAIEFLNKHKEDKQ